MGHRAGGRQCELPLLLQAPFASLLLQQAPTSSYLLFQGFPHSIACLLMV